MTRPLDVPLTAADALEVFHRAVIDDERDPTPARRDAVIAAKDALRACLCLEHVDLTPDDQAKLLFARFMAEELVSAHKVLDQLGAPKTASVPSARDFLRRQDITLGITARLHYLLRQGD